MKAARLVQKIIFFFLASSLVIACLKKKDVPACISHEIDSFKKGTCKNAYVDEYFFQDKKVYVFYPGDCGADMSSSVRDEQCRHLGELGGFSGNQKINGEDFGNAKYQRHIWKK